MSEIGPEMVVSVPKDVPKGWQCPVCGRVYAPFIPMCSHCGKDETTNEVKAGADGWVDVFRTCVKCGGQMQWHKDIALTSLPAQWVYRCKACGNVEYEEIGTAKPAYQITLNGNTVM